MRDSESCRHDYQHHTWQGTRANISADIRRYLNKSRESIPADFKHCLSAFATPEIFSLTLFRIAHWMQVNGWTAMARLTSRINRTLHKCDLPPQSCVGPGFHLPHPAGTVFLGRAGRGLTMYSLAACCPYEGVPEAASPDSGPQLGDEITLGGHSVLMGPMSVGDGAIVAYSIRLTKDVPGNVMVVSTALRQKIYPREQATMAEGSK